MGDSSAAKTTLMGDSDSFHLRDGKYIEGMTLTHHLDQMKLLNAIAALSLVAAPVQASGDAHSKCAQVADYAGCMSFQATGTTGTGSLASLRTAMKQVAARLSSGTSLRDSSEVFRPVTDALAVVSPADQDSKAYREGSEAASLFNMWQDAWQGRINATSYSRYGPDTYQCEYLKQTMDSFDRAAGTSTNWAFKKGAFGSKFCRVRAGQLPEQYMRPVVISRLRQAAIDPKVLAKQKEYQKRAQELAEMEAWERHLEEQPGLKAWADANPALAAQKRKEWNSANPRATKTALFPVSVPDWK
ncbi:hypothetical protein N9T98_00045 [bacterium]|nr:hypothetical protein [bacterium]